MRGLAFQPLREGHVIELRQGGIAGIGLLGLDACDRGLEIAALPRVERAAAALRRFLEAVRHHLDPELVGEIDHRGLVRAQVLRAEVRPRTVREGGGAGAPPQPACGVDDLDIQIAQAIGGAEAGDPGPEHHHVALGRFDFTHVGPVQRFCEAMPTRS